MFIKIHYPDGAEKSYSKQDVDPIMYRIGFSGPFLRFDKNGNREDFPSTEMCIVVEATEDFSEVWLERV